MIPRKILPCTGFSENGASDRQPAGGYAKGFGARLLVVRVIDTIPLPRSEDRVGEEFGQIVRKAPDSAQARPASLAEEGRASRTDVRTFSRIGVGAGKIVSLGALEAADLIVPRRHGMTGVKLPAMGRVARSALKTAHRQVIHFKQLRRRLS
jgi:universal stress protein A